uniref:Uncharacterized protein n=3 Tax=viral metagenome TaxID=1070528 RepID=A0A6M3JH54_9ZZZZ
MEKEIKEAEDKVSKLNTIILGPTEVYKFEGRLLFEKTWKLINVAFSGRIRIYEEDMTRDILLVAKEWKDEGERVIYHHKAVIIKRLEIDSFYFAKRFKKLKQIFKENPITKKLYKEMHFLPSGFIPMIKDYLISKSIILKRNT